VPPRPPTISPIAPLQINPIDAGLAGVGSDLPRAGEEAGKSVSAEPSFRLARSLERALAGEVVRVGTENRAKLGAVRAALAGFTESASVLMLEPIGVPSDVPEQPIGFREIVAGARNRARAAFASGPCAMAVGIEDGLVSLGDTESGAEVYNIGCAWVTDGTREGHGFSSGFAYPGGCLEPAFRDQAPIGDLFDGLWRENRGLPSKQNPRAEPAKSEPSARSDGNIGLLTGGRLDRSDYGSQAVVCALVRFLHTDLYD
jgi:inosine/xanthosine triphosphatase